MTNLLLKNTVNRKLKELEKLQIAFDKKNNVERILGKYGEDIYYIEKDNKKIFQKIGTLFLDYLSDNISEIFNKFIDDMMEKDIEIVKEKYINAYTFYFKYFFDDEYYIEQLEYIKSIPDEQIKEIKSIVVDNIRKIEEVTTLEQLLKQNDKINSKSKKVINGKNFKNINEDNIHIALTGKFAKISHYFFKIAYIKQLYKLTIEYCYFRLPVIDIEVSKHTPSLRILYLKSKYDNLVINVKHSINGTPLTFLLPPAVASIDQNGNFMYCYQIDETNNINIVYTYTFFNISLLNLLESGNRIIKCKNCNSYLVLKKNGTKFCNNPSPQNENQSCSEYMKNLKYKEKVKDDVVAKEQKKKLDRELARIKRNPYYDEERKQKEKEKIEESIRKRRDKYDKGILSNAKYLEWLKSDNKKNIK